MGFGALFFLTVFSGERGPGCRYVSEPEVSSAVHCEGVAIALCEVRVASEWLGQMYVQCFVGFLVQVFCPRVWCCLIPPLITLPASVNAELVTCRLATVAGAAWYHLKQ
ncbi:hypothetical protein BCR43DRAFT_491173 [Syncephalastrum racemosum]|uniref:Uncharacterized protein n=1 Tax=Syncephalastrum racemosum TaxID=13706 RepID=A0A1X2HBL0_SYNRA|nr:hypothetical protein BCR43DRAFT_491173 [Syncephalastrum racemosum]